MVLVPSCGIEPKQRGGQKTGESLSILILDDFDTTGDGIVNINNMKKFCHGDLADLRDLDGGEKYTVLLWLLHKAGMWPTSCVESTTGRRLHQC